MYQRIVVPLDGSDFAEKALPEAERLARISQAPILLIHVVDLAPVPWYGMYMPMEYTAPDFSPLNEDHPAHSYLQGVARRLTAAGFTVETEMCRGLIPQMLCGATNPGDVIVMASHGRSGIPRWILGSVAEEVLRRTSVPVHLVKVDTPAPEMGANAAAAQADVAT